MKRILLAAVVSCCFASVAPAQTHQSSKQYSFKLTGDGLGRYEWTRDFFAPAGQPRPSNDSRWRLQARPRLELGFSSLLLGVGGDFNYSQDENTVPAPALLRDNYKSRDARLDLAFLSLKPVDWLQLQGGRFEMPFGLTEMNWDRDLRPQGGALTIEKKDKAGTRRIALTGLYGQGSHAFDDGKAKLFLGQLELAAAGGGTTLTASYLEWRDIDQITPSIRRQNTRVNGAYTREYKIVDGVLRLRRGGQVSSQLVIDYCRNVALSTDNRGLWIAVVLGSTLTAKGRLEYTYADVDKDAALAAYATDDFFWATGWTGHRADLGLRAGDHSAIHVVGQWQRFKDSPRADERDHTLKRYRAELRVRY